MSYLKLDDYIHTHLNDSIAELSRLCAQPSVSAQGLGIRECAELVAGMLRTRGFHAEIMETTGNPVVYAEAKGKSKKTLLFYNHYDVQPPEPLELWDSPAFAPAIRDGKLFARGVSDDKGHITSRLLAIDAILNTEGELPCNVKFAIEGEEEVGSRCLAPFLKSNRERLRCQRCHGRLHN